MASADQIASPGAYVSKDIGFEVTDGTNVRVTMGVIASTTDATGAVVPTDYGIKVIAADGTTAILDGVSDVPKLVTTASMNRAFVAAPGSSSITDVLLPYTFTTMPLVHIQIAPDATAGQSRYDGATFYSMNATTGVCNWSVIVDATLAGTTLTIRLTVNSIITNPGTTATIKYAVYSLSGV